MTATLQPRTDGPPAAGFSSRASAWLAIGAAVLALVLAPPRAADVLPPGVLGTVTAGQLEQLVGATWRTAAVGDLVAAGAEVRVLDDGVAIRTRDGALSLAAGTRGTLDLATIAIDRGAVLVESDAATEVTTPAVSARGRGAWRLDVTTSPRVGVYSGGVTVRDAVGGETSVGALEQVDVVERAVAPQPLALRYLVSDPWDMRLLAGAIAVDRQVSRLENTLERSYGTALQTREFYSDFVAVDEDLAATLPAVARLRDGDRFGPPAETLVAVVVTVLLNQRAGFTTGAAVDEIAALRRSGATWGIVLARHDLGPDSFREAADDALRRRQQEVAEGTAAPLIVVGEPLDDDGSDEGAPVAPPPSDEPEPDPPTDSPPTGNPPPEDDGPIDEIQDTVDDAVDDVADLLEPIPGGSETVDDLGNTARDVGDAVGATLP